MKKIILLGVYGNNIITCDAEITTRNGYKEATFSFNEGEAFFVDDINEEYSKTYYKDLWDGMDSKTKLNYLNDGNKTKEEVFKQWLDDQYDYREIKDCSCTDYEMDHSKGTINFETIGCGQMDIREKTYFNNIIFTNKNNVIKLLEFWDNLHLQKITDEEEKQIINLMNLFPEENGESFEKFILDNIEV